MLPIGKSVIIPGHFATKVVLEDARALENGFECRVRLPDGSLDEVVISNEEAAHLDLVEPLESPTFRPSDADKLRLLIESARIRLAYAHDRQFAVNISGIRTLPHQIEAVYQRMLPQPHLRFLLADDPGAGKTIMAGLLIKELKIREIISIPQAAEYLGLSEFTLREWVRLRKIPFCKVNGTIKFRRSKLDRWIDRQEVAVRERETRSKIY